MAIKSKSHRASDAAPLHSPRPPVPKRQSTAMIEPFNVLTNPGLRLAIAALALSFMVLEYFLSRLADRHERTHDLAETAASFGVALGHNLIRAVEAGIVAVPFVLAYRHRLFDFDPFTPQALAALLLATEFVYYWHHRASHRIRWMWATHAVHHSTTRMNFTAAIRLGWTGNISGNFLFFAALAGIGFHPVAIVAMLGLNLIYQFFIHTELAPRFGPLEWVLNTPTHHRVHHACNEACLDRNFGGMLIIFDRMFGTFAGPPADEPLRYGLVNGVPSHNPIRIALGEWAKLFADLRKAPTLRGRLNVLFAPPGPAEATIPPTSPEAARGRTGSTPNSVFLRRLNDDQADDVLLVYDENDRRFRLPRGADGRRRQRSGSGVT